MLGNKLLGAGSGIGGPTNGLVSCWRCWQADLLSATVLADKGPGHYNGTLVDSPAFTTDWHSVANRAIALNGTSQSISTALDFTGLVTNQMSLTAWAKASSFPGASKTTVAGQYADAAAASEAFGLFLSSTDAINFRISNGTSLGTSTVTGLVVDTWYHLAGVYNGAQVLLYVNGSAGTPAALTGNVNTIASLFRIGRRATGTTYYFPGALAEVRLYSRALAAGEVTWLASL